MITVGCNQNKDNIPEIRTFSGEELFKAIIFMDGEATALVPLLSKKKLEIYGMLGSEENIHEYKILQNEAVEYIKNNSENYFENFQKAILSENPEKISNELILASNYLAPFAETKLKHHGLTVEDLMAKYNQDETKVNFDNSARKACLAVIIPVVAVIAAGLAIYAWAAIATWVTVTFAVQSNLDKLYLEELSISIAENISHRKSIKPIK